MKIIISIIVLLSLAGCQMVKNETRQKNQTYSFYVGTYTNKESQGIYKYLLMKDGSLKQIGLVAISENPAFLAMSTDKKFLLAVNEIDREGVGTVESFLITDDSLALISRRSSGGAHPCFITVNERGFVLAANYTGGNVGLLRLDNNGELGPLLDVQIHSGSGVDKNQQTPHAHSAWFEPFDNSIICVDKGTNELWFSQLDTSLQKLIPSDPQTLKMEPEAGPRHLVIHPNGRWIYVLNELNNTVTLVQKSDDGNYIKDESFSTLPIGFTESSICADIKISSDGKFVYASNRGHNSIAIFEVNANNGFLNLVGHQPSLGDAPRNISLSPDENFLVAANRHSNNLVSFKRDKITGLLEMVDKIEAPMPACLVF
ncbi:lactonase family protein [candidate division KSB1 bacterium]|nr:lactonase family protein [candidate division KSB1 bacterium]